MKLESSSMANRGPRQAEEMGRDQPTSQVAQDVIGKSVLEAGNRYRLRALAVIKILHLQLGKIGEPRITFIPWSDRLLLH